MTPEKYYELRKHYKLVKEAKQLIKHNSSHKAADMIKFVAVRQKAGMMPQEYIEKYDGTWKD